LAVLFDTLKLSQQLEQAGMPLRQAQRVATALADTIIGDLVTREYLDLRLAETEARLRTEITGLRGEMGNLRSEMIKWIIGTGAVAALPIISLLVTILLKLH
jgi:hypothetical protein